MVQLLYSRHTHPTVADTDDELVHQLYGRVQRRPPPDGRPWVALTMVASVDGATAVDGRSARLGGPTDATVFAAVRDAVDVIVVGRATAAAERYRPPTRPGLRIGVVSRGVEPERDAELLASELFTSGCGFWIVPADAPTPGVVDAVRAGDAAVDLGAALTGLRALGIEAAVVGLEGGPALNAAALTAGLVDEVNLTVAATLAGGASTRLVDGAPQLAIDLDLEHALLSPEALFTRWLRRR